VISAGAGAGIRDTIARTASSVAIDSQASQRT
jgi:hypothetical protein